MYNTGQVCCASKRFLVHRSRVDEFTKKAIEKISAIKHGKRDGAFYDPTVIGDVPKTADVAKDMEIFGPVVPIIAFDTEKEAIEIANASKFGLCGCVFTENMKTAARVANALECGGAVVNGASFFRSFEMPFGGYKASGIGTEGVFSTFNEMTHTKSIVLKNIL